MVSGIRPHKAWDLTPPSLTPLSSPGNISPVVTVNSTLLDVKLVSPMLVRTSSPEGCTLYCSTVVRTFTG